MGSVPGSLPAPATVRVATSADIESIRELVTAAYARYVPRIGRRPKPMDDDYQALIDAGRVWVADDGAGPAGVAGVLVLITHDDHLLVHNIAVAERIRGTGLGSQLLGFAEQQARDLGLPEVRLFTNVKMTENLAYYPRRGYRRTGERVEHGLTRVYFAKSVGLPDDQDPSGSA
jgi:GNAT superfamily N-acetyltransferase